WDRGERKDWGLSTDRLRFFDAGDERPDPREVHFLDRDGIEIRLREERRQVEIRLEADVHGQRRDAALDPGERAVLAAEVIQENDPSARTADAVHLAHDGDRIRHDADQVRRVDDV